VTKQRMRKSPPGDWRGFIGLENAGADQRCVPSVSTGVGYAYDFWRIEGKSDDSTCDTSE
jgi:hypothetical protein